MKRPHGKGSASFGPTSKRYSISGSVSASYDFEDNTFSPSLTIGGSWSNNPSSYSDSLKYQQTENAVLTADLATEPRSMGTTRAW